MVGIDVDVTTRKAMESELADAARRDKLTGLTNRAVFMKRLEAAILRVSRRTQTYFSVLFLDFDRFKLINDTLGHEAGDELLRQIAARLRKVLRAADTASAEDTGNVVSRFGGDEFLVLINDLKAPEHALRIAERLLDALAPPYQIQGSEVHSSASIGIVTSDQCRSSAEDVVRNADVAMYEAKRAGRACSVVFNESMHARLTRHVTIENNLRRAIGGPELYLNYQPIIDLSTNRMVSAEALVRWNHPVLGEITPAEFIPIAEETGLIVTLGEWVQNAACEAMAHWRATDPARAPATISVNLSRAELALGQRLLVQIKDVLRRHDLPPDCLQLEITEREIMRHPEESRALMVELRELGVKLAMDDFGTGTSSLAFLRNYPFDTIKIDRSFLQDLTSVSDVLAVIHATINLVENLGMASLAEGVEDAGQLAILQSLGCRYAQGYLFSRPVGVDQLLSALQADHFELAEVG
jgi:diguanylate cyclase (GGDEF)-like protein